MTRNINTTLNRRLTEAMLLANERLKKLNRGYENTNKVRSIVRIIRRCYVLSERLNGIEVTITHNESIIRL